MTADPSGAPNYDRSWTIALTRGNPTRSAESWARGVLEGAPRPLAHLLVLGWRLAFRFALGPQRSRQHVLGWQIVEEAPETITVAEVSAVMRAVNRVDVASDAVTWTTRVWFGDRAARPLWALAAPVHGLTIRYLLRRERARRQ